MPNALFYGNGTALITPFINDKIDYGAWERLIDGQLEAGVDALIVLGSTGESPTVTNEERRALVTSAVMMTKGRAPVIVSASSASTRASAELAQNARALGADGILLSPPYYNRPTPQGIRAHFLNVADAAGIPIIAYNIPSRTGVNISPALMADLARHPMIRGLKEASTDAAHIADMLGGMADGIAIYAGNDMQTISIMAQGGRGVISVAGNIAPREMGALTRAMLSDDCETARSIFAGLSPLLRALTAETNPGPIKYAMSRRGMCDAGMRLPLAEVSESTKALVDAVLM